LRCGSTTDGFKNRGTKRKRPRLLGAADLKLALQEPAVCYFFFFGAAFFFAGAFFLVAFFID
jgi:hypothetical protein